jgi:hypothetical protein
MSKKVFKIQKNLVRKLCKKSIVLVNRRRIRIKNVVDDISYWIIIR